MFPQVIFLILLSAPSIIAIDEACTDIGGTCQDYTTNTCIAGYEIGLCSGDSNVRCCLECDQDCQDNEDSWSQGDSECERSGGECKLDSNYCDGIYVGGKCGGPSERKCCEEGFDFGDPNLPGCPRIYTRQEWNARPPKNDPSFMEDSVPYWFVHHTESFDCYDFEACVGQMHLMQDWGMDDQGWNDIPYSFLIGGDGNVYEGRGWNTVGAHTQGYNSVGYASSFIGGFMDKNPTEAAMAVYHELVDCAVANGKIVSDYNMYGHRQAGNTDCPGDTFYDTTVTTWPHWTPGRVDD